ncbi:uncharacterized protein C8A04DRAFT_11865 [Dichotomopilus funicola]|uniref:F-box domain-containing protein n=1 Tax=Dichotomopilus funicola TaxID=1934379 RepID=A0AAN6ZN26_9PEZI|nr:hypothetical protein C8A04DRAFT_11865 [Dichotomopilus funicola]
MSDEKVTGLASLPLELFDKILSMLDSVYTLGQFVRTSRFIYGRFNAEKAVLIWRALQRELGPGVIDAKILYTFEYAEPNPDNLYHYHGQVRNIARIYISMVRGLGVWSRPVVHIPTPYQLTEFAHALYKMNKIADLYIATQLQTFRRYVEKHVSSNESVLAAAAPLTPTERHRVLRALYRRQIVSNAWAPTRRHERYESWEEEDIISMGNINIDGREHDTREVSLGILAAFEPWGTQQVDHINLFLGRLCIALDRLTYDPPPPFYPILPQYSVSANREVKFGNMYARSSSYLVQYIKAHPDLVEEAVRILSSQAELPPDHESLQNPYLDRYGLFPLTYRFQRRRYDLIPHPETKGWEEDLKSIDFAGDEDPDADAGGTPWAWPDALNGHYVNWYGEALHMLPSLAGEDEETKLERRERAYRWRWAGFCFWDRERVEALKKLDEFKEFKRGWVGNP